MKKTVQNLVVVAAVVAVLMAALAPGASAKSRNGDAQQFQMHAETKHEICHLEGANICPPEPFEIVWVCITTGMLAGTECPHMNEAQVRGSASFAAVGGTSQGG